MCFGMENPTKEWFCTRTNDLHVVDAGLEIEWLESLNSFQLLCLTSICEGHLNGHRQFSTKSMPILRVVVDSALTPNLSVAKPAIEEQMEEVFNSNALRLTTQFHHGWSDNGPKQYCLSLDAKKDRTSNQMEEWVRDWFKESITFLRRVDALVATISRFSADRCQSDDCS